MSPTKRRDAGSGSVYQGKDGYWRVSAELGWEKGKRKRKVFTGTTKSEAVEKKRVWLDGRSSTHVAATNIPKLADWLEQWDRDIASRRLKVKTLTSYRSEVSKHIVPFLGHHKLDKLKPSHIVEWHNTLRREKKANGKGTLAESSVLKAHAVLSRALNDAVTMELISRNPAANLDRPSSKAENKRDSLSVEQALALLRHVRDTPLGSRWATALLLGTRQGETLGMEWERVDLKKNLVDYSWQLQRVPYEHGCEPACGLKFAGNCPRRQLTMNAKYETVVVSGGLCLTRPKGERQRIIPMPPQLLAWLRKERKDRPGDRFVWQRPDGRPLDPRADYAAAIDLLRQLGHKNTTLHELRHTTSSLLARLGVPEHIRMAIMGHSQVTTQRNYAHVDTETMSAAMVTLDEALQIEQ
jgi:integrase